jgi:anti-anti-sigma factor
MQIRKNLAAYALCGRNALELANRLSVAIADDVDALVLSFKDVADMDVSGVAALVRIYSNLEQSGRRLVLTDVPLRIRDFLDSVGLAHLLLQPSARTKRRLHESDATDPLTGYGNR